MTPPAPHSPTPPTASLQAAVEEQAQERDAALSELSAAAEKQADKIEENRWILPVSGYHITNTFGVAASYYASTHTGLDFACASGTPIHAIANGVISDLQVRRLLRQHDRDDPR